MWSSTESPPQTATEGKMVKVLPERVRLEPAVGWGWAIEEGRPNPDEGG